MFNGRGRDGRRFPHAQRAARVREEPGMVSAREILLSLV